MIPQPRLLNAAIFLRTRLAFTAQPLGNRA
jgi:hypothetical protein